MNEFTQSLPIITFFGIVTMLAAQVFFQFRQGTAQGARETILLLQAQNDALEKTVNSYQTQITELTAKMGKLEGILLEKEKKLEEYLAIIKGKDPMNVEFVQQGMKAIESSVRVEKMLRDLTTNVTKVKKHLKVK